MITVERAELRTVLQELGLGSLRRIGDGGGLGPVEADYRSWALNGRAAKFPSDREARANLAGTESISYTTGPLGGYFVPKDLFERAFNTMKQYDQIFDDDFSNIVETDKGTPMPFPAVDDTVDAIQVNESAQSSEVDASNFASITLNSYAFRTQMVAISMELLQDSGFPIGEVLEKMFARRLARGVGKALINGAGGGVAPTGLITALAAGTNVNAIIAQGGSSNTGNVGQTGDNSVGTIDLANVFHGLNEAYRIQAAWYMNDGTLQLITQLLSKSGQPIVPPSSTVDYAEQSYYLYGKPVCLCNSFPVPASSPLVSGQIIAAFGDPNYFFQRRVKSATYLRRFEQAPGLVENGLVGFEMWTRVDSNLILSTTQQYQPFCVLKTA